MSLLRLYDFLCIYDSDIVTCILNFSKLIKITKKKKKKKKKKESELFTGDTSKDNHSPRPVIGGANP